MSGTFDGDDRSLNLDLAAPIDQPEYCLQQGRPAAADQSSDADNFGWVEGRPNPSQIRGSQMVASLLHEFGWHQCEGSGEADLTERRSAPTAVDE